MALWEVTINGKTKIEYSEGAWSTSNPVSGTWVRRHVYEVPYTNVGLGGIVKTASGTYHTPSWIKVHEQTTINDIRVKKNPFDELFTSNEETRAPYEPRKFTSATSDKIYTVKLGKNGFHCDCMGYIAHRKCKHIKQATEEWDIS
tara:strand:- start:1077 stop:1511 length:435 start_codon:yes stop_codon:yes gene_type:complete